MKKRRIVICILMIALLLGTLPRSFDALRSQAAKSTQEQVKEAEQERNDIKEKLDDQKDDIKDLKGEKRTLQDEMSELNESMLDVCANLVELENQINAKSKEIEENQERLAKAIEQEEQQQIDMEIRARKMYERNVSNYVSSLLQAKSIGSLLNLATWFERVEAYDQDTLKSFQENRADIEALEVQLESQKQDLDNLLAIAQSEKDRMSDLINGLAGKIDEYSDQIDDAEQKALDYEKELKKAEEDLKVLQKRLEEELRRSREAAEGKWRSITEVTFEEGDRKLLANIIYCEAGGEPYEGKLAVGAVVINRVLSNKFPDTVAGVVYQKGQFSPVASGRLGLALAVDKATPACYQAADEAMLGVTNVGICVFFRTPVPGLTGINIGGHVFY